MEESYIFSNDINSLQHTLTSGHELERERERGEGGGEEERFKRDRMRGAREAEGEEEAVMKRDDIMSR